MYGNAIEWVLDRKNEDDDHSWCLEGCTDPDPHYGEYGILKGGGVPYRWEMTRISYSPPADNQAFTSSGMRCVKSPVSHTLPDGGIDWAE